jgi:hypothetical protein
LPGTKDLVNYLPEERLGEVQVTSSLVTTDKPDIVKETRDHRSKRSAKDKQSGSQPSEDTDRQNESAFPPSEDNAGKSDQASEADDNDLESTGDLDVTDLQDNARNLTGGAAAGLTKVRTCSTGDIAAADRESCQAQSTSAVQPSDVPLTRAPEPEVSSSGSSSSPINVRASSTPGENGSVDAMFAQTANSPETTTKPVPPDGVSESSSRDAKVSRDASVHSEVPPETTTTPMPNVPTNNASTAPTTPVVDRAEWPDWLVKQIGILESVKEPADVDFQRVVNDFAAFEHALGYPEGQVRVHFDIAPSGIDKR